MDKIADNLGGDLADADSRPEDLLRAAIVGGRLLPGERLVEAELTRRFGAGRAAIRTALARLEHERLVVHEPHRGARVRLVELDEGVEILEARAVLEGLAARHAALRATAEDSERLHKVVADMRALLRIGDVLGASNRNADLHRALLEIAGHATASRLVGTLRSQLVRYEYRTILLPGRPERSLAEHAEIVEAVAAGDAARSEAAMRTHLGNVADALPAVERR
ncbi:MAG: GntR family transcriptional regulator [Solirubrobacteraceae bacterium]